MTYLKLGQSSVAMNKAIEALKRLLRLRLFFACSCSISVRRVLMMLVLIRAASI